MCGNVKQSCRDTNQRLTYSVLGSLFTAQILLAPEEISLYDTLIH